MKKIIMMTIILFGLSYSISHADDCGLENCILVDSGSETDVQITIPNTSTPCSITLSYTWEIRNCNGNLKYSVRMDSWIVAVASLSECPDLFVLTNMFELAFALIVTDPAQSPFPPQELNDCYDGYFAEYPGCWQWREVEYGPSGDMIHYYPCDNTELCCKPYTICIGQTYDDITITSGSYLPVNCEEAIGDPGLGFGCFTSCP